jgi:hypothetical protein
MLISWSSRESSITCSSSAGSCCHPFWATRSQARTISSRAQWEASNHSLSDTRVSEKSRIQIQQRFKLTLVNGEPISVSVTDLDPEDFQPGETEQLLERATLDAASVASTLHVLEGIAAEGKAWLRERRTGIAVMRASATGQYWSDPPVGTPRSLLLRHPVRDTTSGCLQP